ncbi:hypothetical protein LguiA_016858 [Lonicera macranthoides]
MHLETICLNLKVHTNIVNLSSNSTNLKFWKFSKRHISILGGLQDLSHQQKLLRHHSKHFVVGSSRCTTAKTLGTRLAQHPRSKRM